MMVTLGRQLDYIWNELHPAMEDTPVGNFLLGLEWMNPCLAQTFE